MKTISKKALVFVIAAITLVFICIYCLVRPRTTINIDKFSAFMLASSVYYDGMEELDSSNIERHYGGIASSDISQSKILTSTDGREFAVIQANSPQSADTVQSVIGLYCSGLIQKYQSDDPEKYDRLQGYVIRRTRNYVILTISDRARSGNQLVYDYFDKTNYDKSE